MTSAFNQLFPGCPQYTTNDVPDQTGKVHIVTGGSGGVGFELCKILYQKNATVYIAARSQSKIEDAVSRIKKETPESRGRVEVLILDLADFASVRSAAGVFQSKETRLDVLFHNAGVMVTPADQKSTQDLELQMGTNAVGPYLFTKLLEPILVRTAKSSPVGSVRLVWVASLMALGTPPGGIVWTPESPQPTVHTDPMANYMQSKAGVCFLAHEFAKKLQNSGISSMSLHPGMLKTDVQRHMPAPVRGVMGMVFPAAVNGAYSELFAAFSPDAQSLKLGEYVIPFGRVGVLPEHIVAKMDPAQVKEGERTSSATFLDWCESVAPLAVV